MHERRLRYLKQKVAITGLGVHDFTTCMENIGVIQNIFMRSIGEESIIPWTADSYGETLSMEASSRIFSDSRQRPNLQAIPFEPEEDPHGFLSSMTTNGNLVRSEDNRIYYSRADGEIK